MRISVAVTPGMSCARPTAGAARTAAEAATSWRRVSMFIALPFFLLFIPWPYRLAEGRFLPHCRRCGGSGCAVFALSAAVPACGGDRASVVGRCDRAHGRWVAAAALRSLHAVALH